MGESSKGNDIDDEEQERYLLNVSAFAVNFVAYIAYNKYHIQTHNVHLFGISIEHRTLIQIHINDGMEMVWFVLLVFFFVHFILLFFCCICTYYIALLRFHRTSYQVRCLRIYFSLKP